MTTDSAMAGWRLLSSEKRRAVRFHSLQAAAACTVAPRGLCEKKAPSPTIEPELTSAMRKRPFSSS